jgi:hypothetical protein
MKNIIHLFPAHATPFGTVRGDMVTIWAVGRDPFFTAWGRLQIFLPPKISLMAAIDNE